jgi:linoleate 10R-lipoxygenase
MVSVPLKTDETPHGLLTEWEFFEATGAIFTFLFFNGDEGSGLKLKNGTQQAYDQLVQLLKVNVTAVKDLGAIDKAIDDLKHETGFVKLYGDNLIRRMLKAGYSIDSIIVQILLTSTGNANLSTQVSNPPFLGR